MWVWSWQVMKSSPELSIRKWRPRTDNLMGNVPCYFILRTVGFFTVLEICMCVPSYRHMYINTHIMYEYEYMGGGVNLNYSMVHLLKICFLYERTCQKNQCIALTLFHNYCFSNIGLSLFGFINCIDKWQMWKICNFCLWRFSENSCLQSCRESFFWSPMQAYNLTLFAVYTTSVDIYSVLFADFKKGGAPGWLSQ